MPYKKKFNCLDRSGTHIYIKKNFHTYKKNVLEIHEPVWDTSIKKKFHWNYKKNFLRDYKKNFLETIKNIFWNYKKKFLQTIKKIFLETINNFLHNYKKNFLQTIKNITLKLWKISLKNYKKNFFLTFFKIFFYIFCFCFFVSKHSIRMMNLTRKKNSTNTKKRGILRLLSTPARYVKCEVNSVYRKLVKKTS